MDPKENIERQVSLADEILAHAEAYKVDSVCVELSELVLALHEWRSKGGFDPYTAQATRQASPRADISLNKILREMVLRVLETQTASRCCDDREDREAIAEAISENLCAWSAKYVE